MLAYTTVPLLWFRFKIYPKLSCVWRRESWVVLNTLLGVEDFSQLDQHGHDWRSTSCLLPLFFLPSDSGLPCIEQHFSPDLLPYSSWNQMKEAQILWILSQNKPLLHVCLSAIFTQQQESNWHRKLTVDECNCWDCTRLHRSDAFGIGCGRVLEWLGVEGEESLRTLQAEHDEFRDYHKWVTSKGRMVMDVTIPWVTCLGGGYIWQSCIEQHTDTCKQK